MKPSVSIILPTRNAGPEFSRLLKRLTTQKGSHHPEIVVVDSGSSDGTPDAARCLGASVIEIPAATFNHGLTRNLGIENSHGEICILLVQDALPATDQWFEAITRHFDDDPLICGVTTRQVPRPDADAVVQWEVLRHSNALGLEVKTRSIPDWRDFERLPFQDRLFICNFDNVCSAIRRSAWEIHPFRSLPFAEDLDWAVRVLRTGSKIVYEPAAVVLHSHDRPAIYHLRRHYVSAKIVPTILECPISGMFSTNDEEMFGAVSTLVQEACSLLLLVDQVDSCISSTEWRRWVRSLESANSDYLNVASRSRDFARVCLRQVGSWSFLPERFRSMLKRGAARQNPMRAHFLFLLSEIVQDMPELDAVTLCHLIVHSLARSVGHFLGSYYLWSDRLDRVSLELRELDRSLSLGV